MRILLLILCFVFTTSFSLGQICAVSNDKANYVYRSIENPMSIAVSGVKPGKIYVTASNCILDYKRPGRYVLIPSQGDENKVVILIYEIRKKDTIEIGHSELRIKELPDPTAFVYGKTGSFYLQKGKLIDASGILAKLENFDYELVVIVKSFEMTALINNEYITLKSGNNIFTKEMLNLIVNAQKGTCFIFQNIIVGYPENTERRVRGNLQITIE
jgi:hypothetical protein